MIFQTSDVIIYNGETLSEHQLLTLNFTFKLFHRSVNVSNNGSLNKILFVIPQLILIFTTSW